MTPCCFRQRVVNSHPKEMQRHLKGLSPGSTAHHVDRAGTWLAVLRGFWRGFGCGAACLWHRGPGGGKQGIRGKKPAALAGGAGVRRRRTSVLFSVCRAQGHVLLVPCVSCQEKGLSLLITDAPVITEKMDTEVLRQ